MKTQDASTPREDYPVCVIANPKAGGGSLHSLERALRRLEQNGLAVEARLTAQRGDARRWAEGLARRGDRLVIAAGGDGTVNEVLNGLVCSRTALGVLPMGSTNVFPREMGFPLKPEAAADALIGGRDVSVPLGRIDLMPVETPPGNALPAPQTHYFLMMAGIGFDAAVVREVDLKLKDYIGKAAYLWSALQEIGQFRPKPIRAHFDDGERVVGYSVIASNIRSYGGRFAIAPDGDLAQVFLHAIIFRGASAMSLIRYVIAVALGRHTSLPDVRYRKAERLKLDGSSDILVQLDGDFIGRLPAEIRCAPGALLLRIPRDAGLRQSP